MKCLVKGCSNHDHEGGFNGTICTPCYNMITTGIVAYGHTFIHDLRDELLVIATMFEFSVVESLSIGERNDLRS